MGALAPAAAVNPDHAGVGLVGPVLGNYNIQVEFPGPSLAVDHIANGLAARRRGISPGLGKRAGAHGKQGKYYRESAKSHTIILLGL